MAVLAELTAAAQTVAERIGPAVVTVGHGAGVVVEPGLVVTNAHNLRGREVPVAFLDGRVATARLAGADVDGDLAVLEVDTGTITPAALAEATPTLGAPVFAVTLTRNGPRVTWGTVSAAGQSFRGPRGRLITDALEHTAPLARGGSGSPVVDEAGRVVGLNTHRRGDRFYLAIPATPQLRDRLAELRAGDVTPRPRLGIAVAPPQVARRLRAAVGLDDRTGLLVRDVDAEGPAARAGIRRGDLLVAANGRPVTDSDDLFAVLDGLDGGPLTLGVVRGSDELTVAVTFGDTREEGSA